MLWCRHFFIAPPPPGPTHTQECLCTGAISGERNCGFNSSFPYGPQLQCPSMSLGFKSPFVDKTFHSVKNWRDCAQKCAKRRSCRFWSWFDRTQPNTTVLELDCVAYSNAYGSVKLNGTISGERSCSHKGA